MSTLKKELLRDLGNRNYELSDTGIYFPKSHVMASGMYIHDVNGKDEQCDPNLVTDEGLLHMLSVNLFTTAKISTWYLSLYAANYTPLAGLTAASYPATTSEITSGSEGYSESVRQTFVSAAPTANAIDNLASKAVFTIVTASSLTVNGAGLSSSNVKGGTAGVLISATKFAAARTLYNTDLFNLGYKVQLAST